MSASIYAFEVGQGDCHIIVAGRAAIVIDAGPGNSPAIDFLIRYGYQVEHLILTHNDSDHSTGALRLLTELGKAGRISSFGSLQDRPFNKQANRVIAMAMELADKRLLNLWRLEIGLEPTVLSILNGDYTLSLLHPTYIDNLKAIGQYDRRAEGPNRTSAVLRLSDKAGTGIGLWSGDLPCDAWEDLVKKMECRAKWFVIPHHGSARGWSADSISAILASIAPEWVIVSVGTGNQHSHPSNDWITAARARNAHPLCTQITAQCHHNVEALGGAVLPRDLSFSRRRLEGTACAGTIIYRLKDRVVLRSNEHQTYVARLSKPMCRAGVVV
jgi:beta-lactamase superfamily II metal-dependent hydrolase